MTARQIGALGWLACLLLTLVGLAVVAGWAGLAFGLLLAVSLLGLGWQLKPEEPR